MDSHMVRMIPMIPASEAELDSSHRFVSSVLGPLGS